MALAVGARLGPYEILSPLGAGGMGEVYRARDTKLNRDVALKVLPESFATDPDRLARFQREAQVLASLNHPNIAHIHGLEDSGGVRALVMELVEGEDLAQRLTRGAIPIEEALPIAKQIAEALEAAHEQGIVHRDLKPANIKVRSDGTVKVLDFGLAKALDPAAASRDMSQSPTITTPAMTQAGMILGTAAYMSPEQAKGRAADRRSDIWAFGVLLYEMLTGQRAFKGEDVSDTLAAILRGEPDWTALPADTPPPIRRLLHRCLEKDRKRRLDSAAAARLEIDEALAAPSVVADASARPAPVPRSAWSRAPLWAVVGALATGLLLLTALARGFLSVRQTPTERVLRYALAAPENGTVHSFAVSPDGRYVTIAAAVNGRRRLWLQPLDALQAQPMPDTEDATYPFWSPDSRYVGFFAQGKLKKIAARGGPTQSLCPVPDGRGGSWNREDVIVFSSAGGSRSAIQRVPAAGGVPFDITKIGGDDRFPVFLPDGHHFLYLVNAGALENRGIYLSSLDGSENRRILADVSAVAFAPLASGSGAGHLLFIRNNALMAQPFDARSAQLSGDVFPIAEGMPFFDYGYAPVAVSDNGILTYSTGGASGSNQIVWFDRAGKQLGPASALGRIFAPSISPDEKMIAFTRTADDGATDIWLRDLARGTNQRFTTDASRNFDPFWSPNADRLAFRSDRQGSPGDLYQRASNGSGEDELLVSTPNAKVVNQWSRNDRIVYTEIDPKTNEDLWVLSADRKPVPFWKTEFKEFQGQISSDGHWMAYTSDESRQREVYVRPFPAAAEGKWKISTAGGEQPRWRGDGKELFFVGADEKLTAVAVKGSVGTKPSFDAGTPTPLFEVHLVPTSVTNVFQYDVTADGKRFLVNTNSLGVSPPITVVVNWSTVLKK